MTNYFSGYKARFRVMRVEHENLFTTELGHVLVYNSTDDSSPVLGAACKFGSYVLKLLKEEVTNSVREN